MKSLTARLAPVLGALRPAPPRAPEPAIQPVPVVSTIDIPVAAFTEDERQRLRYFAQGQFLARQENWAELGWLIRMFDTQRLKTDGGRSVAEILAEGARADAVEAAGDAVRRGDVQGANAPIYALEEIGAELCEDHGVALVLARTHMDIGRAWQGGLPADEVPPARKSAFLGHFRAAAQILDRFDAIERESPALAAARCAALPGDARARLRLADDYEDLIDLDPQGSHNMRAFGRHLLPRFFGSYEMLDAQARRVAALTQDVWGAGGYVWVHFDALALDPMAFRRLDGELFVEGLHDILACCPDQHTANLFAAYTGLTLSGMAAPGSVRERIAGCFGWIVRDHLREVHPMIWAAAPTAANEARVKGTEDGARRGQVRALSTLGEHFAAEIRAGGRLCFEPEGLRIDAA